jgi:poly(A) polymerase
VGQAYSYLLELRLDRGPMDPEEAETALRQWWETRQHA